jgi:hypothetical protein
MTNSLWGTIPLDSTIKPPIAILKEQATALTEQTGGLLEGRVFSETIGSRFYGYLDIYVPTIGYAYRVLNIAHEILFYPVSISSEVTNRRRDAADESALLKALNEILSSPEVHKVVVALLAQARSS